MSMIFAVIAMHWKQPLSFSLNAENRLVETIPSYFEDARYNCKSDFFQLKLMLQCQSFKIISHLNWQQMIRKRCLIFLKYLKGGAGNEHAAIDISQFWPFRSSEYRHGVFENLRRTSRGSSISIAAASNKQNYIVRSFASLDSSFRITLFHCDFSTR